MKEIALLAVLVARGGEVSAVSGGGGEGWRS